MKILTPWLRSYLPELPVSDTQLAEDLTLRGIAVEGVFLLASEQGSVFEMDITTNRVDAMNHYGIAREAATIYGLRLQPLETTLPAAAPAPSPYPVRNEAPDLCGRFTARVVRNARIAPSTGLVQERFRQLEQKPIYNAVDATNYVTLAIGQPTHVFDLDTLQGGVVIRRARAGECLRTLDGLERTLDPDDLVIADEQRALSLAGVMGGWDSRVTESTRNILVEAAWFDPRSIRRTSKRHAIHTDASHRFERGADFHAAPAASALVTRILLGLGPEAGDTPTGATLEGELIDLLEPRALAQTAERAPVLFAMTEVRRLLGPTEAPEGITEPEVESILTGLGCTLTPAPTPAGPAPTEPTLDPTRAVAGPATLSPFSTGPHFHVTLPSWRLDLERPIDLIEEIARVYGYNRFQNTLPSFTGTVRQLPHAAAESTLRRTLLATGLSEAISSTFCSATDAVTFAPQPASAAPMENPLSEEANTLRPSLIPGMLTMLAGNLHRDTTDVALFELGTTFLAAGNNDRVDERPSLALGLTGSLGAQPADFFLLKGIVEALAQRFASRSHYFDRLLLPAWLHPGRGARMVLDGSTVAFFGQLHPDEAARRKLKQPLYLAELRVDRLYAQGLRHPVPRELSRYPAVRRDFSFLLPASTPYAHLEEALRDLGLAELTAFAPRELLHASEANKQIPAGHFSLLLGTTFQSNERTLREEELQGYAQQVITAVQSLGGRLRE